MSFKKTPKYVRPVIPDETLEKLIDRYSLPVTKIPNESIVSLSKKTEELKGWLSKKTNYERGFVNVCWLEIREALDTAVATNNLSIFDEFVKAWNKWDIKKPQPPKNLKAKIEHADNELAALINEIIPFSSTNKSKRPRKLELIYAIQDIQRKENRAPTRLEIEDKAQIEKNKVCECIKEMGLSEMLSSSKRAKEL